MNAALWSSLRSAILTADPAKPLPPNITLPTLPSVLVEFTRKADDPDCSAAVLGAIVESDAGLTCELLKYANSSVVGLRTKASSARQAISLLGIRAAKTLLLAFGMQRALAKTKSKLVNLQVFWLANLERALIARTLARLFGNDAESDVAFAAAIVQDALLPVLTNEQFDAYLNFLERPDQDRPSLDRFERKTLGWDHAHAAAQMLTAWGFPDDLTVCVLLHHQPDAVLKRPELKRSIAAANAIASWVPDAMRQSVNGLNRIVHWCEEAGINLEDIAVRAATELAEISTLSSQHTPLHRRLESRKAELLVPAG